jgi:signal transduction histidine kinase/ActR/RegA family two-component response regulator
VVPERPDPSREERVLVLAPVGRDAELTVAVLNRAGIGSHVTPSPADLAREIGRGVGLALVTAEALTPAAIDTLAQALAEQPPWSDLPILAFTSSNADEGAGAGLLDRLQPLGNVSLVDRPIRGSTLISMLRAALRARRRQYQLRDLLDRLGAGVRQRDEFLAMLGHELRNPLAALSTALHVIDHLEQAPAADGAEVAARQKAVVRRQVQVLGRLVDDLLEVSRVTSGKLVLQRGRVDLGELARRSAEALRPMARSARVELHVDSPAARVYVDGDSTRLEQVVVNLLTNAVKYTPAGGKIELTVKPDVEQARLSVRDTGVGMGADLLPNVFDLFRQADHTLHRSRGGLGIGLTLVRSIVEMHGGTVLARSAGLGRGSELVVILPMLDALPEAVVIKAETAGQTVRRRVFVLEDNDDNREGLVILLQQLGHEATSEGDGPTGARRIIETRPELALIDIGLPEMDGYEVARQVRAALGPSITLVALTGYGTEDDRERALAAGFDAHMSKPIDFLALRRMLSEPGRVAGQLAH